MGVKAAEAFCRTCGGHRLDPESIARGFALCSLLLRPYDLLMTRQLSRQGAMEIIAHEAIVLSRYHDVAGVWTIGIGHTASAGPPDPESCAPMTLRDAIDLFLKDVAPYVRTVDRSIRVELDQHEFDALVSFHFNTGGIERAELTDSLNRGDRATAADQFMNWRKPAAIIPRRKKEQALFAEGIYTGGGRAMLYRADSHGKVAWDEGTTVDLSRELDG